MTTVQDIVDTQVAEPVQHRTFRGSATLDFKIVLTDKHITDLRELFAEPKATPFMKLVNEQHPVNDDAFAEAILRNGVRGFLRDALVSMLNQNGFGGSVSPAKIELLATPPEHRAPANIVSIDVARRNTLAEALADDEQELQGASNAR